MKIAILAAGVASAESTESLKLQAAFRKATPNMMLVFDAIANLSPSLEGSPWNCPDDRMGIVLGSSHGELETTIDFLSTLGASGVARPFLFQNSLHNATLGFITLQRGIRGPAFTLSDHFFSGEDSLDLACDLLEQEVLSQCLVVGVESTTAGLADVLTGTYPPGTRLKSGSGALLLTASPCPQAMALLTGIECNRRPGNSRFESTAYYDSNAVEHLARAVTEQADGLMTIQKPNGAFSTLRFESVGK